MILLKIEGACVMAFLLELKPECMHPHLARVVGALQLNATLLNLQNNSGLYRSIDRGEAYICYNIPLEDS